MPQKTYILENLRYSMSFLKFTFALELKKEKKIGNYLILQFLLQANMERFELF